MIEPGYYWVVYYRNVDAEPEPAKWTGSYWMPLGTDLWESNEGSYIIKGTIAKFKVSKSKKAKH